jgi:hypothetical protein
MIIVQEINYTVVRNLKWTNPEHTAFDCEVNFNHLFENFVPFHCTKAEAEGLIYTHTTEIWERALSGEFGPIAEYEEPVQPEPVLMPSIQIIPSSNTGDFT